MEKLPKKRKTPETDLQAKVMRYLRYEQTAYKCALTNLPVGADSGYPDITCIAPNGIFVGIELKSKKGRQSEKQKKWERDILANGGKYLLARSVQEVDNFLA